MKQNITFLRNSLKTSDQDNRKGQFLGSYVWPTGFGGTAPYTVVNSSGLSHAPGLTGNNSECESHGHLSVTLSTELQRLQRRKEMKRTIYSNFTFCPCLLAKEQIESVLNRLVETVLITGGVGQESTDDGCHTDYTATQRWNPFSICRSFNRMATGKNPITVQQQRQPLECL